MLDVPMRMHATCWAIVVACTCAASLAHAESDPSAIAATLPIEVVEVVAGGTWIYGDASGTYRTITIQGDTSSEVAQVYLQWVGSRSPVEPIQILSSVPLREFNDRQLSSPSVALDAQTDGQVMIAITGQDSNAQPVTMTFVATEIGQYAPVAADAADGQK